MFWYNNMDHSIENAMQLCKRLLRSAGRADAKEQAPGCRPVSSTQRPPEGHRHKTARLWVTTLV